MQAHASAYDLASSKGVKDLLIIDQEEDRARSLVPTAEFAGGGATCRHLRLDASPSKAVAEAIEGTDVVKQEFALDTEARHRGVTIIPDCRLATAAL